MNTLNKITTTSSIYFAKLTVLEIKVLENSKLRTIYDKNEKGR